MSSSIFAVILKIEENQKLFLFNDWVFLSRLVKHFKLSLVDYPILYPPSLQDRHNFTRVVVIVVQGKHFVELKKKKIRFYTSLSRVIQSIYLEELVYDMC